MSPGKGICGSLGPFPKRCTRVVSSEISFNCRVVSIGFYPVRCVPLREGLCLYSFSFSLRCSIGEAVSHASIPRGRSEQLDTLSGRCIRSVISGTSVLSSFIRCAGRDLSPMRIVMPRCLVVAGRDLGGAFRTLTS